MARVACPRVHSGRPPGSSWPSPVGPHGGSRARSVTWGYPFPRPSPERGQEKTLLRGFREDRATAGRSSALLDVTRPVLSLQAARPREHRDPLTLDPARVGTSADTARHPQPGQRGQWLRPEPQTGPGSRPGGWWRTHGMSGGSKAVLMTPA